MSASAEKGAGRSHLLAAAGYTLLTVALSYPVAFRLASHIAGFSSEDNLQWRWFLWWFKHALLALRVPFTDLPLLYAPLGGEQPLYATISFIPALALPVTLLAGPTASFNLTFLLAFVLSAYTAYLLAYYLTGQRAAAFLAGLIFSFYPARFGYATGVFLGQLTVYFLPLYVLALWLLARRPTWRRAVWAGLLLAGLGFTWPLHVAYGVGLFTLPFLAWQAWRWLRQPRLRAHVKYFALAFGLALVLVTGPYLPLLASVWQGRQAHLGHSDTVYFSADLLAFIAPSNYHPLWQPLSLLPAYAGRVLADRDDIQERLAYIGLVPFLLALFGLVKFGRRLLFWLVTALLAATLSLGPLLKINGSPVQFNIDGYVGYVVLPYALLRSIPILDWGGVVARMNVVTMLSLAVMAAYGAAYLFGRLRAGPLRAGLALLLALLILVEYATIFPFPTQPDLTPAYYSRLAEAGRAGREQIIDFPLVGEPEYTNLAMHYQTVHHQPIAGGHLMRKPAGAVEMLEFLNQLLSPPLPQAVLAEPDPAGRLGLLNRMGFTRIVVRQALAAGNEQAQAQLAYLSGWLGQPRPEGEVAVFDIPPGGSAPAGVTPLLGPGWQPAEEGRLQLNAPAGLLLYADAEQAGPVSLRLSASAPQPDRFLAVDLDGRPAFRLYLSGETLDYRLPLTLPPGGHQLTFYPEEACRQNCAPVVFSRLALDTATPEPARPVVFGDRLALARAEVSDLTARPGQPLLAYLYWQGTRPLAADYSAFVHLVSPGGELVGQADYLLGGWLYPTSAWPEGFMAAMPSLFFIPPGASPGQYRLQAGLYRAGGERLRVSSESGRPEVTLLATVNVTP